MKKGIFVIYEENRRDYVPKYIALNSVERQDIVIIKENPSPRFNTSLNIEEDDLFRYFNVITGEIIVSLQTLMQAYDVSKKIVPMILSHLDKEYDYVYAFYPNLFSLYVGMLLSKSIRIPLFIDIDYVPSSENHFLSYIEKTILDKAVNKSKGIILSSPMLIDDFNIDYVVSRTSYFISNKIRKKCLHRLKTIQQEPTIVVPTPIDSETLYYLSGELDFARFIVVGQCGEKIKRDNVSYFPYIPPLTFKQIICRSDIGLIIPPKMIKGFPSIIVDFITMGKPIVSSSLLGETSFIDTYDIGEVAETKEELLYAIRNTLLEYPKKVENVFVTASSIFNPYVQGSVVLKYLTEKLK